VFKTLLEQYASTREKEETPLCEDELVEKVEEAIRYLETLGRECKHCQLLVKKVGIPLSGLKMLSPC